MNILNMSIYYCGYGKFKKKRTRRRHSPLPFSILWWSRSFGEICENLKKKKLVPDTVCVCVPLCVRDADREREIAKERKRERDCKREKERESWVWVSLRNGHKQIGNIC